MRSLLTISFLLFATSAYGSDTTPEVDLDLPKLQQVGVKTNCGPTAAAMLLAAYHQGDGTELRDKIGEWTWLRFPLRAIFGTTTLQMLKDSLNHFSNGITFDEDSHPWLPKQVWAIISLKARLKQHRPLLALVDAKTLWGIPNAVGLHWIVVRGFSGKYLRYNDPADNSVQKISISQFWGAWSLGREDGFQALVPDKGL